MPSGVGKPGDPVNIEVWNPAGSASREVTLAPGIQVPDLIPLLPGLRFTIDSTDVGLEKDGMVTLDEAMSVSRGTLNFWKDGYDDTNWEYKHHWYEVETAPDEYTWVEHLNELEKKDLQTNGAGTESITHYKINHDRYGGVSAPIYDRKENLDDGSDTSHMPEEGDKVTILGTLPGIGTFNGANYMDEIKTSTAEQTIYAGNGILMGPQDRIEFLNTTVVVTSGDIILKEGNELRLKALQTSSPVQCTQNHIKIGRMNLTDQMTITGAGIVVSGAFKVFIYPTLIQNSNGHGIRLDHSGSCQIEVAVQTCAGDGWRLEGSNQNRIGGGVSGCGARGYYIADSHNNGIGGFAAANCTGIGLLMEQCLNNEVMGTAISQCAEGIRLTDCENCKFTYGLEIADCQGNGVTISGGQANNLNGYGWITPVNILRCKANGLEVVNSPFNRFENMNSAGNTKNGIVLHGDNSSYNTFRTINSGLYHNPDGSKDIILLGNGENGVYLYDGACHNSFIIDYYPNNFSCNSLNGVLLEGEKTQYNQFTGNIGFFTQSYWNVYPVGNGGDGIRFTGGASHNQILNSQIHFNSGNGILLEGTGTSYNVVSNTSVGTILVEGGENPGSRANKGLGIYITDPACYNTFTGVKVGVHDLGGVYCGQLTALPENGLSNVVFDNCDIGWVDTIQMNSKGNTAAGNAVQADACGLELSGCSHTRMNAVRIKNYHTGLYIAGGDPTGHYLDIRSEDCTGDGISIDGLHDQSIYRLNAFNCGSNGIVLKNAVNIEFEESNAHYSFMNGGHGLLLENCRDLRLPGLPLTQNTGDGLRVRNSSEVIFVDVNLSDNGGNGAAILANSSFVSIHDGMIDNNGGYGVCMQESTDLQVCPLTSDEHMGIGDNGAGCALVQDAGNIFIGSGIQDRPLYLSTDLGAAVTITGPGTDNVRVSGCSFSSNGPDVAQGILISGGDNILIGNRNPLFFNNINLGAGAGIQAQGNVHNLQILNNIIGTDPSFNHAFGSFPNQIGILFQNGLTGAITADNTIIMNSSHGVLVRDGANANIFSDNEIVMNGGDGIRIEGIASNHNLITCNRIFNNAGKGIALDGGNDNIAAPVITNISESSSAISGVINPVPPAGTLVEVYSDRDDEGESLLGIAPVLGNNFCVNATIPVARLFHAVAVHPEGNTSEFGTAIPYGKADWYSFLFTDEFLSRRQVHIQKAGLPIPTGLTPEGVNEWDVQAGADGEGLVFVSDAEGNPDIRLRSFLLNKTFSLTSNSFPDYSPSWLNGQNRLAFVSERDGNPEIYTLDFMPDLPLGEIPASEGDMEDAVSRETGDGFGARFDSAPGKIRQLHFYIADEPACFEWRVMTIGAGDKPDSIAASGDTTPTVTGWHVVDIAPIAAPHPFAVCIIFRNDRQPFIGLAERSLSGAYYSLSSGSWYSSIASYYMIRAVVEPESPARITDNGAPDLFPDWSPDGSTIAFASSRSGTMDVWLMDFDGMNPRKITDGTGLNTKPVWSPDGTLIAFVSNRSGNNDIYTIKPDGTGLSQVTNDSADDTDPVWAPDGEILLFSSNRSGDHEIYGQRIVSGAVQRLTWRSGGATEPEVTTDVFLRNSGLGSAEGGLLQNGAEEYMTHDADVSSTLAISLSSTKAMPGDSVEMTLEISDAQNLGNLAFEIAYDPTVLQITSNPQVVINGSTIGAIYPDIYPDDFGIVQFNCVHPEGYNSGGVLLRLSVKIKPSVQDARTILALENKSAYAVDLTPLHTQSQDGVITFYLFTGTGWVTY